MGNPPELNGLNLEALYRELNKLYNGRDIIFVQPRYTFNSDCTINGSSTLLNHSERKKKGIHIRRASARRCVEPKANPHSGKATGTN